MGRVDILEICLRSGLDVNLKADDGFTPLHCAARMDQADALRYLLRHGASANTYSSNFDSSLPIHEAVSGNSFKCFSLLLQANAEIRSPDGSFKDIVNCIASSKDPHFAQSFVDSENVAMSLRSKINAIALAAAGSGHLSIIQSLIKSHPTEVQIATNSNQSPLSLAARRGHASIVKSLLDLFQVRTGDKEALSVLKTTSLRSAAKRGHFDVVKALLLPGNPPTLNLREPAVAAIENNQVQIVKYLVVAAKGDGHTLKTNDALRMAVKHNRDEIVTYLASLGRFDSDYHSRGSVLQQAIGGRCWATVEALLCSENGNVNVRGTDGVTSLEQATMEGNLLVMKLLLQHKDIDVNISSRQNTALDTAIENTNLEAVALLLSHPGLDIAQSRLDMAQSRLACISTAQQEPEPMLRIIFQHPKIDVNAPAKGGDTLLHCLVRSHRESRFHNYMLPYEVMQLLLCREDINTYARDSNGYTATELAHIMDHWQAYKLLLEHECPDLPLHMWSTNPLILQVQYEYGSRLAWQHDTTQNVHVARAILLQSLVANIISPNAMTWDGKTLLHFAVEERDSQLLETLLSHRDLEPTQKYKRLDYSRYLGRLTSCKLTPSELARLKNNKVMMDLFLKYA